MILMLPVGWFAFALMSETKKRKIRMRRGQIFSRGAIVTRKVLGGEPIGFAERLAPRNHGDSGWIFIAGTETQDSMDDPANLQIVRLSTMAQMDPEIGKIVDAPIGSVFRRTHSGFIAEHS